jgi:hypothetical protein
MERVAQPRGEGAREEVAQGLRVHAPEGKGVVVDAFKVSLPGSPSA